MEEMINTDHQITKEEFVKELEAGRAKVREEIITSFENKNELPNWNNFNAVSKFRSVKRAVKRGHVDIFTGIIYPSRPFHNKKTSNGRRFNELKKKIYGQFKSGYLL